MTPHPSVARLGRPLVLASGSPRRRDLLAQLGASFEVASPDVDETPRPGEAPVDLVVRLARDKATAIAVGRPDAVVVAADTVVDIDGEALGKPGTDDAARYMLGMLSGRRHLVHTGLAVTTGDATTADATGTGPVAVAAVTTSVEIASITEAAIDWYVATGEPHDKAGAYAIQGHGGVFVTRIDGSTSNVVGLPLAELSVLLAAVGR